MTNKNKIISITIGLTLCFNSMGCQKRAGTVEKQSVSVKVENPVQEDMILKGDFIGTVAPNENICVISSVSGKVEELNISVGSNVSEGDILCKIDDTSAEVEAQTAQTALNSANDTKNKLNNSTNKNQSSELKNSLNSVQKSKNGVNSEITNLNTEISDLEKTEEEKENKLEKMNSKYKIAKEYNNATEEEKEAKEETLREEGIDPEEVDDEYLKELESDILSTEKEITKTSTELTSKKAKKVTLDAENKVLNDTYTTVKSGLDDLDKTVTNATNAQKQQEEAAINAKIAEANTAVTTANYKLDMYNIKSPIDGIVESISVTKNNVAAAGKPVCVIANKNSMIVTFYVSEEIRDTFSVGDNMDIEHNGENYNAKIVEIGQSVNETTRLFEIKGEIDTENKKELLTGTSVSININTYKENNTLIIPYDSVYYDEEGSYVYTANENDIVEKKYIEKGLSNNEKVSVLSGLENNERVITSWSPMLTNGVTISEE